MKDSETAASVLNEGEPSQDAQIKKIKDLQVEVERLRGLLPAAKLALRAVTPVEQELANKVLWDVIEKADPDYMITKKEWLAELKKGGDDVIASVLVDLLPDDLTDDLVAERVPGVDWRGL